ncbi:hypothetical protein [Lysobacter enzymogenes]|uniref:hypothetical protein n=1 Tax=Lysobacter enzymogenes TaxID=69 RepID=UPI001A977414|nr:hypothetical protein [Lysobacter enzymogenes]QQP95771.1 hypothetical protein JHW38_21495 [Lysobacter enzymogenes]
MSAWIKQARRAVAGALVFAASLNALAGFQPPALPPESKDADIAVEIAAQPVVAKQVFYGDMAQMGNASTYYYQAGGGSLLAGLLLGPAAVAVNAHNVKERTQREAAGASGADALDPRGFFVEPFARYNAGLGAVAAAKAQVTPYLIYSRPKNSEVVYRLLGFDIAYAGWSGRYTYHYAPVAFESLQAPPSPEQAQAFAAETERAGALLLALFNAEARRQVGPVEQAQVVSMRLTPLAKGAKMPMGLRGEIQGHPVVLGEGAPGDGKRRLMFTVGAHVFADQGFEIAKRMGEVPQR